MKKAQLFDISLAFIVLGAMISIMMVVNIVATETSPWKTLGQRAFELQNTYAQADIAVATLSSVARWAAVDAVRELGDNGGFIGDSPCGMLKGIARWNTPDAQTWCVPTSAENFNAMLNEKLVAASRAVVGTAIPYEFLLMNNTLVGIATVPLRVNIMAPAEKKVVYEQTDLFGLWTTTYAHDPHVTGLYVFRPNIETPFNYDLRMYQHIARALQTIRANCVSSDSADEHRDCIAATLTETLAQENEKAKVEVTAEGDDYGVRILQHSRATVYTAASDMGKVEPAPAIRFFFTLPQGAAS